ncbi:hypothetical protein CRUP_011525, partial [Coryphaenoides rupestris]
TPWTPWAPVNVSGGGARREQRWRYTCRAALADAHLLQLGKRKAESRSCPAPGAATDGSACETDVWLESWSSCSRECSGGFRVRRRPCSAPDGRTQPPGACSGSPVEYQDCNTQPCAATSGFRVRRRPCSAPDGRTQPPGACSGSPVEYQDCNTQPCAGEGAWSDWGPCDSEGRQVRGRLCGGGAEEECPGGGGNGTQTRPCPAHQVPAFTLFQLLAVGGASFFLAALLSALAFAYCQRLSHAPSHESAVIHPSTPNHLTYGKQANAHAAAPKNDKYTPMEFKVGGASGGGRGVIDVADGWVGREGFGTLNKNNLHANEDTCNYFTTALPSANVYTTTTYYPTPPGLGKYDYRPDSPCRNYMHS